MCCNKGTSEKKKNIAKNLCRLSFIYLLFTYLLLVLAYLASYSSWIFPAKFKCQQKLDLQNTDITKIC